MSIKSHRVSFCRTITIPLGVSVDLEPAISVRGARQLQVRGPLGSVEKTLQVSTRRGYVEIHAQNLGDNGRPGTLEVSSCMTDRRTRSIAGTCFAIIKSMILGVTEGHTYRLRIVSTHFPINLKLVQDERYIEIRNLLGGRQTRRAKIEKNTKVEIDTEKEEILVRSTDKEAAGQTAANIETTCLQHRLTGKHGKGRPLVFLDGIYIKTKP